MIKVDILPSKLSWIFMILLKHMRDFTEGVFASRKSAYTIFSIEFREIRQILSIQNHQREISHHEGPLNAQIEEFFSRNLSRSINVKLKKNL